MNSIEQFNKPICYNNSTVTKFCALPKIGKSTLSFRPIVSSTDASTESIFTLVCDIFISAYHHSSEYYIRYSFQFAHKFNNFQLPKDYVLVSLVIVY